MTIIAMMATRRIELGAVGERVAHNLTALRKARNLSQPQLAKRMTELGRPMAAAVLSKTEKRDRRVDVDDLVALAIALGVTPNRLLFTAATDTDRIELTPALTRFALDTLRWANGKEPLDWSDPDDRGPRVWPAGVYEKFLLEHDPDYRTRRPPDLAHNLLGSLMAAADRGLSEESLVDLVHTAFKLRNGQAAPRPTVVAAVVTSDRGVLVGRRKDGKPPWTFIAGEQEPGERPEDTVVREVKEETGLEVRAGQVIGERDHPATGRHMIYMAATPARGTEVFVGDEAELDDVQWVSLAEADELLAGMYEPVHEYLARELGTGSGS